LLWRDFDQPGIGHDIADGFGFAGVFAPEEITEHDHDNQRGHGGEKGE
jgi:hypothetical protein